MTHPVMRVPVGNSTRGRRRKLHRKERHLKANARSRQLFLEPLEDRLLLSNGNLPSPFFEAPGATTMTLRIDDLLDVEGVDTLRLLDTATGTQLASVALSDVSGTVQIIGSNGNDTLLLDIDAATIATYLPNGVSFNGRGGTDELIGPDETGNTWHITASGAGTVGDDSSFVFTNVELLTGGNGQDTLVGPDSDLGWSIDGVQSGTVFPTSHRVWPWPAESSWISFSSFEVLQGGDAADTLDYSKFPQYVQVDLSTGTAAGDLTVVNFDNFMVGSGHELTGDQHANVFHSIDGSYSTLAGGPGDDYYVISSLSGPVTVTEGIGDDSGQGFDTLDFSAVTEDLTFTVEADGSLYVTASGGYYAVAAVGVERLIGGSAVNTLDYSAYLGGGVDVDLAAGRATLFPNLIGFTRVIGTSADDHLRGDGNANVLTGNAGDDSISGGGGADSLSGGLGVDRLVQQADADMLLTNSTFTVAGAVATIWGFELAELSGGPTSNTIDATAFTGLTAGTPLSFLNNGAGVRRHGSLADFRITLVDGTTYDVNLAAALTVQDALDAINSHAQLTAQLTPDGTGIIIVDASEQVGVKVTTVTPLNGSHAAEDLGLTTVGTPEVLVGAEIPAGRTILKGGLFADGRETVPVSLFGLRTSDAELIDLRGDGALTLLSALNNGDGVDLSGLQITLSDGTAVAIDMSGAATVQNILDRINDAHDDLAASISAHGCGIVIRDDSDGEGRLEILELAGTTAADLGILGTGDGHYLNGEDISRIAADLRISFSDGTHVDVDLSGLGTVVEVLDRITASHPDLLAQVNADGTGINIVYSGAGGIAVADINNSLAATDLLIAGPAAGPVVYGGQLVGGGGSLIRLDGRLDHDTLIGSRGNDRLTGGGGSDTLRGGLGTNALFETRDVHMTLTDSACRSLHCRRIRSAPHHTKQTHSMRSNRPS